MANHTNLATSKLKEERLQTILGRVESYLQERKQRQLLEFEIRHMTLEFEYNTDKIPAARKSLSKIIKALSGTERRYVDQKQKLSGLQKERGKLGQEYTSIKASLEDLENKRSIIPELKDQIERMQEEARMSSQTLKERQTKHRELLREKENLGKEPEALRAKLSMLKNEIPVIKNTRDILTGCMPERFESEEYFSIQEKEEIEKSITNYVVEVKGEIQKIMEMIPGLKAQTEEKDKEKTRLLSKNEHLLQKHKALVAEVGEDTAKPIIEEETTALRGEKQRLAGESDLMTQEVSRLETEIKRTSEGLEREKKVKADSMERYAYLTSKKQKMEEFDSIEAEIKRLKKEAEKYKTDSGVNTAVIGVTREIKQDLDPITGKLQSAIEHYNKQFEEFGQTITRLFS